MAHVIVDRSRHHSPHYLVSVSGNQFFFFVFFLFGADFNLIVVAAVVADDEDDDDASSTTATVASTAVDVSGRHLLPGDVLVVPADDVEGTIENEAALLSTDAWKQEQYECRSCASHATT